MDGEILSFGKNVFGQLGNSAQDRKAMNNFFKDNEQFKKNTIHRIYCGQDHTYVVTSENKVFASGFNEEGQLGIGSTIPTTIFTEVLFP
jgi:alpha-tubulin suppressor-like RCC1 family protein